MEIYESDKLLPIILQPSPLYAFARIWLFVMLALVLLFIAWWIFPAMALLNLLVMTAATYKFFYFRTMVYTITPEVIRISTGVFAKRLDSLEMYRVKDYVVLRPFLMRLFCLMNLTLKTTDPGNPEIDLVGIPFSGLVDTIREHVQAARQHNHIYEIN